VTAGILGLLTVGVGRAAEWARLEVVGWLALDSVAFIVLLPVLTAMSSPTPSPRACSV
jgi:hypothetical protein